jgi:hypothetical protein
MTHVDLERLEITIDGSNIEIHVIAHFGIETAGHFNEHHTVNVTFTPAQTAANLTPEEKAAVASIKAKVIASAATQVPV